MKHQCGGGFDTRNTICPPTWNCRLIALSFLHILMQICKVLANKMHMIKFTSIFIIIIYFLHKQFLMLISIVPRSQRIQQSLWIVIISSMHLKMKKKTWIKNDHKDYEMTYYELMNAVWDLNLYWTICYNCYIYKVWLCYELDPYVLFNVFWKFSAQLCEIL